MVAKAWGERERGETARRLRPEPTIKRGVEEMFVQNDTVSLCLLLNRRTRTMRVVDFRAGPSHAKRLFVLKLAKREGIEKVYTLVERDEVSTWVKLGFAKEANIAGFYKRSDAFILGCSVPAGDDDLLQPLRVPIGLEEDDEPMTTEPSPAHDFAEKTLVRAKKHAKELQANPRLLPPSKLTAVNETDTPVRKAIEKAVKTGRALTAFEAFGRDVERRFFSLTSGRAARGFELIASTESQSCFGNAFLELLSGPKTEVERLATVSALRALCEKLLGEGVVSCFAMAPSDDVALATAFVFNGFRRTGLLQNHVTVGGERRDAIVWSRKLANPADE